MVAQLRSRAQSDGPPRRRQSHHQLSGSDDSTLISPRDVFSRGIPNSCPSSTASPASASTGRCGYAAATANQPSKKTKKTLGELAVQLDERSTKLGFHSREIQAKIETLTEYNDELALNENAAEIEFTTVLSIGALDEATLTRGVDKLCAKFRKLGIRMQAPRGAQAKLWMLLNPGAPPDEVYADYQHIAASSQWAGFVPFTTARLP